MAIVEIPPDFSHLTTADRILELLREYPQGLTIQELADSANRPISMLQIYLKNAIANHKVAIARQQRGTNWVKVYILTTAKIQPQTSPFRADLDGDRVTPERLREVAGLTKLQLAEALGLSIKTINDWERKRSHPRLAPSQLKQMMCVYQCTLDELIAAFE